MQPIKYDTIVYDRDLITLPVIDNHEPLIDLSKLSRKHHTDIKIELEPESRTFFGKNICLVRKSVGEKLIFLQKKISPSGIRIVILDAYRPVELQMILIRNFTSRLKSEHPDWDATKIKEESIKFVAPVEPGILPPHSTGGAVDLTLEKDTQKLDMGSPWGELSERSRTHSSKISEAGRKNRIFLAELMHDAGFVNYPLEWWHWSIGDRTYAYYRNTFSFYGMINYGDVKWMIESYM